MQPIEIREYKLYLFDLDSTLTETISGEKFPRHVNDRIFMDGRWEKLLDLHAQEKFTAIITNQGGAAWGLLDQEAMNTFLRSICMQAEMDAYYVCYRDTGPKALASDRTIKELTLPEYYKGWDRRKPGPGMLIEAMEHFSVSREDTLMVGDREEDKLAALAAGVDFQWTWDYFGDPPLII